MKASELQAKSSHELNELLNSLNREQFALRMQKAIGQLTKSDEIRRIRKDIARINTVLNAKGIR